MSEEFNRGGNEGSAEERNREQDDVPRPLELSVGALRTLSSGSDRSRSSSGSEQIPCQPGRSLSGGSTLFRPLLTTTGQIWLDQSEVRVEVV